MTSHGTPLHQIRLSKHDSFHSLTPIPDRCQPKLKPKDLALRLVSSYGPNTQRYLELLTSGTRSLRHELRELRCLGTVYGSRQVEESIGELLSNGVVGASRLERALRLREAEPKAPLPMSLVDERLQFATATPQLESYDALLLKARSEQESPDDDQDHDENHQEKEP